MKEELRIEFQTLIDFAKSFGEDEEECWGNLEHAYNVLYNNEEQADDLFSPERDNNEYVVGIIGDASEYAYDDKLRTWTKNFYEKAWDILIG